MLVLGLSEKYVTGNTWICYWKDEAHTKDALKIKFSDLFWLALAGTAKED